jgi:hypothetical protein
VERTELHEAIYTLDRTHQVARLTVGGLVGLLDPEAWVERTISSGGQYSTDVAEVRLYGTEKTRTLEIVANTLSIVPPAFLRSGNQR